jgi:antirestriction protein ArdC
MAEANVYDLVTERILEALDRGVIPWKRPWSQGDSFTLAQRNAFSKRAYRGINVFLLSGTRYSDPRWGTFNQIKQHGGHVVKGAKSQIIVFWRFIEREETGDDGEKKIRSIPYLRYFRVFNIEDTEGLKLEPLTVQAEEDGFDPIAEAEAIAERYLADGPSFDHDGGNRAFYRPSNDSIHIPARESFNSVQDYYDTKFHEIGHSTGHSSRLDRLGTGETFGSHGYGREELVAEFTSAFLCSEAGIDQSVETNQAAYIENWKRTIQADRRAVVVAAGQAQKAADLVLRRGEKSK